MIKNYQEYLNESSGGELTEEQIEWLDDCSNRTWKINPQSGFIDVEEDFDCSLQDLDSFKGIQFGEVKGYFNCGENNLTSLKGAPKKVGFFFSCGHNMLTNLEGSPQSVVGGFSCKDNELTSLEGAPDSVGDYFDCYRNNLTNLKGAPSSIGGRFLCWDNKLTSLEGFPEHVGDIIDLDPNPIWNKIKHVVGRMQDDEKKFLYKILGTDKKGDEEHLNKIIRAIERMRMI